jgi:hypothetical protein
MGQRGGIWDSADQGQSSGTGQGSYGGSLYSNAPKNKSPAILKVEHDLDVFVESIQEAENRIRKGDLSRETQELVRNLQEMGPKIQDLSLKLKTAGEYETSDKAIAAGTKLSVFMDNLEKVQRSGPQAFAQSNSNQGFQQPQKPSGGFFEDFNRSGNQGQGGSSVSFDNFNQFGQSAPQPPQPKPSSGGGFWEQDGQGTTGNQAGIQQTGKSLQSSGGFFDTHFDSSHTGGNHSTQTVQNNRPTGQGFFDQHFGGGNTTQTSSHQQKIDEVNLLGIDANTSNKTQSGGHLHSSQNASNPGGLDLLSLGTPAPVTPQPASQNFNPFGGQPQQVFGGPQFHQGGQQPYTGIPSMGHNFQPGFVSPSSPPGGQNFGSQAQGINPLMYQHMIANHQPLGTPTAGHQQNLGYAPAGTGNSFGVSNNIRFTSETIKMPEKRTDPFSDLTTDLV